MDHTAAGPSLRSAGPPSYAPALARRMVSWGLANRGHRIICLLAGLWLLNAFDLLLTMIADAQGMLHESNPIVRWLLPLGPGVVLRYKLALVLVGTTILFRYRRHRISEIAASGLFIIYALVAVRWSVCYELYEYAGLGGGGSATGAPTATWPAEALLLF